MMIVQIGNERIIAKGIVVVNYLDGNTMLYIPGDNGVKYIYVNPTTVKSVQIDNEQNVLGKSAHAMTLDECVVREKCTHSEVVSVSQKEVPMLKSLGKGKIRLEKLQCKLCGEYITTESWEYSN